ncbi:MAG TPA: hypothetical protein VEP49_10580 [Acidimicrobiia bacterium]|nr:hypothetical protein [Acidimicrobiia bacterium]
MGRYMARNDPALELGSGGEDVVTLHLPAGNHVMSGKTTVQVIGGGPALTCDLNEEDQTGNVTAQLDESRGGGSDFGLGEPTSLNELAQWFDTVSLDSTVHLDSDTTLAITCVQPPPGGATADHSVLTATAVDTLTTQ